MTDEWIRSRCKESWIFDAAKQWVRMTEAATRRAIVRAATEIGKQIQGDQNGV